jgi:RNA polymerase sigma-70 factor (ECF subfamily)
MNAGVKQVRDEWIALRCRHGEPEAFADLVREMERPLLYFAQKLVKDEDTALDVLQEVWLKAFRTIRRLENPGSVRAWLYRLTRGLAIDHVRKEAAEERREQVHAEERAEERPDPGEEPAFDAEDAAALHRALDTLDIRHREVLVLHFLEEMTLTEIGAVLGCPAGTVKSRIHYAKGALQAALREEKHGPQT